MIPRSKNASGHLVAALSRFQFRHFKVAKNSICLGFYVFRSCKQLFLKFFRGFQLLKLNNRANIFKHARHAGQKKKTSSPWRHSCVCSPTDHEKQPITALAVFITLYKGYHFFYRRWCSTARATRAWEPRYKDTKLIEIVSYLAQCILFDLKSVSSKYLSPYI